MKVMKKCMLALTLSTLSVSVFTSIDPALTATQFVSIQSSNFPNLYIRHRGLLADITPIESNLDKADATFRAKPGLAFSGCVSFESINFPGFYLRHQEFRVKLQENDNTPLFKADATFCIQPSLNPNTPSLVSFRSYNLPNHYIRHRNSQLFVDEERTDALFKADATFRITFPFVPLQ